MGNLFKKLGKKYSKKAKKIDKGIAKVVPKKQRKKIAKGAKKFSKQYEKMDKKIYKKLSKVPIVGKELAEGYEFGANYANPLSTIKNASDVISGRQSLVEGLATEFTPVGDIKYARGVYKRKKSFV